MNLAKLYKMYRSQPATPTRYTRYPLPARQRDALIGVSYKQAGFIQAVYIEVCFLSHAAAISFLIYLGIGALYSGIHIHTAVSHSSLV